jgi:peptidyl-prolyl cis-trans isomerase C
MGCIIHPLGDLAKPKTVSVNGVVVERAAIARETQNHPAPKPILAWQSATRALAVRELLLQEARRQGVAPAPRSDADGRRETDEEALIRALTQREILTPEPDEESCRRYYTQNRARFRSPTIFEAAHILFAACRDDEEAFARAREAAAAVRAQLRESPDLFGTLAAAHSACPSAAQEGNLGQISAGQTTPEFEQALFVLAPGEISDLVETRYGVHIIRLDRKIEARDLPFELVAERIAQYLREAVTRRATAQYIARLASAAEIVGVELAGAAEHRVN